MVSAVKKKPAGGLLLCYHTLLAITPVITGAISFSCMCTQHSQQITQAEYNSSTHITLLQATATNVQPILAAAAVAAAQPTVPITSSYRASSLRSAFTASALPLMRTSTYNQCRLLLLLLLLLLLVNLQCHSCHPM
jgi:hypothetical protein